ncbi:MAG: chloride channel protein [Bacteroidetes bacterium 4572_77]|nr:MAG: chloride channel protein [Bacteroidetes bacterium 4572_77]
MIKRIRQYTIKNLTKKQATYIIAIVIGFFVGLAAVIIKKAVHFTQWFLTSGFVSDYENYFYFFYPMLGIFLALMYMNYIVRKKVGHGIPAVLYAISKQHGIIPKHNLFSSIFTASFTVGFGGSVGLEGPTVYTGAAIGSFFGQIFKVNYRQIIFYLGFASAAAMAAIFKAPISGIVFALEVIMLDLTMAALIPLLLSSVTAVITSYIFMGQGAIYAIEKVEPYIFTDTPWFILLGIFTGLVSTYFTKTYIKIEGLFSGMTNWRIRLLVGGSILGVLVFLFPSLYGEGYDSINAALHGGTQSLFDNSVFYEYKDKFWVVLVMMAIILLTKVIATSVTFGAGGVGGIFAPSLFLGTYSGLFFAKLINNFTHFQISERTFALVGMAGVISGNLHAPLTAIFLIAEITTGYELFVPLMITAAVSYATTRVFVTNSVYTHQLAKRGELVTHDKDKAVMRMLEVNDLIERSFKSIEPQASLGDLVNLVSESHRNVFPVVDDQNEFHGVITLDEIRHIMFKPELYKEYKVEDLMFIPVEKVDPLESMEEVAKKFTKSGYYNLPVVKDGKYWGFVSRATVFSAYRKLLKDFSDD